MAFFEARTGKLTFAEMLHTLRKTDEMTQEQFAKLLDISKQHVCDIEHGRKVVSSARAAIFAKKLGYPPTFFIQLALQDELKRAGIRLKIKVEAA